MTRHSLRKPLSICCFRKRPQAVFSSTHQTHTPVTVRESFSSQSVIDQLPSACAKCNGLYQVSRKLLYSIMLLRFQVIVTFTINNLSFRFCQQQTFSHFPLLCSNGHKIKCRVILLEPIEHVTAEFMEPHEKSLTSLPCTKAIYTPKSL